MSRVVPDSSYFSMANNQNQFLMMRIVVEHIYSNIAN